MHFFRSAIILLPLIALAAAAPAAQDNGLGLADGASQLANPAKTGSDNSVPPAPGTEPIKPPSGKPDPKKAEPTIPIVDPSNPNSGKPGSVKPEPIKPQPTKPQPKPSPVAPGTIPTKPDTTAPKTSYFLTSKNIATDNSTATLNIGGQGTVQALGTFDANSGVRWTHDELEVGYKATVNGTNTLGGGYTIKKDGISVGAGIGINGVGTSFKLETGKDGKIFATVFGDKLKCVVNAQGNKATCTN
ncbi:unnamed protein product [Tilletia laevis]|uniref:Hyphally-regulated cell wall protein N-terminal domain-containing protein n=2 Tax=Tilletia TaxID=13289 RepID=A0A8T8TMX8_9BASI|nr:hypothetical protein CF336_g2053 [Tilletia laevis]KAE8263673.1 hypothetical protein A4X03_0g1505 [Tilletia caries]KAE8207403.1 hypothetical protein CF335_g1169 [Tilletia laevis]CAD6887749.1 unnamed protein product [Tilletia caries]CAD6904820.1 unnamed protein product [Tilletia caries]